MSMDKTMTFRMNNEAAEALENLSEGTDKSKAEVIREGLVLAEFFEQEKEKGKKIFVIDEETGDKKEVVWT